MDRHEFTKLGLLKEYLRNNEQLSNKEKCLLIKFIENLINADDEFLQNKARDSLYISLILIMSSPDKLNEIIDEMNKYIPDIVQDIKTILQ